MYQVGIQKLMKSKLDCQILSCVFVFKGQNVIMEITAHPPVCVDVCGCVCATYFQRLGSGPGVQCFMVAHTHGDYAHSDCGFFCLWSFSISFTHAHPQPHKHTHAYRSEPWFSLHSFGNSHNFMYE